MAANFCHCCAHCQALKEIEESAEKRRGDFEEEVEKKRQRMEDELAAEKKRVTEEGVIYGDRYECYGPEDILKITNVNFLRKLSRNIFPSGQPPQEEFDELVLRARVVETRLKELNK